MLRAPPEILVCSRQLGNNRIRPFSLAQLRSYCNQEVVSLLDPSLHLRSKLDNDRELIHVGRFLSSGPKVQVLKPVRPELRLSRVADRKISKLGPTSSSLLKGNKRIELLCQDSGIRGCWFRCHVLMTSLNKMKIRYEDVIDVDSSAEVEEWVVPGAANPDKLGIRCSGRKNIRPCPPKEAIAHCTFEIGSAVDAWWCDGWWEGIVIGRISEPDKVQVYLPGMLRYVKWEDKILILEKRYLRNSRDWVVNKWVEIMPKPDIVSFLSTNASCSQKPSRCSNNSMEELPALESNGVPSAPDLGAVKELPASEDNGVHSALNVDVGAITAD